MAGSIYELAILLSLKDLASGGLGRTEAHLRSLGKEGKAALQTFQNLREESKRGMVLAGVGVAGLAMMRKGIQTAADFEQAIADLRMSIQEVGKDGTVNLAKMNSEMGRFESLSIRLGNTLPGSTQDFVEMFSVLKNGGLATEKILNGAGEAVANLAVVTHSNPAELAKEFAQLGEMFQLSTQKEWNQAANTFQRVKFATGVGPSEMVEGMKFAQIRGGAKLGIHGIEGAETLGRVLGTLRTFGLEGGFGGRELSRFLSQLASFEKNAAHLKKKEGIDLKALGIDFKFFDNKGKFAGFDSLFKQLEQLRKLTDKQQVVVGEKLFTAEGTAIATAFMQAGEEGWKKINQRVDSVASMEQNLLTVTDTWNAKLENIQGTVKNLVGTAFTPLLSELKPMLDTTNAIVGAVQGFSAEHQGLALIAGDIAGISMIALTLAGLIKAGAAGWALYGIASKVALKSTQVELAQTEVMTEAVAGRMAALRATVLGMSGMQLFIGIAFAAGTVELLSWLYQKEKEWNAELEKRKQQAANTYEDAMASRQLYGRGAAASSEAQAVQQRLAKEAWESMQFNQKDALYGTQPNIGGWHYDSGNSAARATAAELGRTTSLQDPMVLAKLIRLAETGQLAGVQEGKPTDIFGHGAIAFGESLQEFKNLLKMAFGEDKFKQAQGIATQEMLGTLAQNADGASKNLKNLNEWFRPMDKLPPGFERLGSATDSLAFRIRSAIGLINAPTYAPPGAFPLSLGPRPEVKTPFSFTVPSKASGGMVESGGMVHVHDREAIVPARVTARWRDEPSSSRGSGEARGRVRDVHVHLHVATDDPRELARLVAREVEIQMERA